MLDVKLAEDVLDKLLLVDATEVDVLDVELDSRLLVVLVAMLVEGVFVVTVLEDVTDQGAVDDVLVLVEVLLWVLVDRLLLEVGVKRLLGVLVVGEVEEVVLNDKLLVDDTLVELVVIKVAEELDSTASRYPLLYANTMFGLAVALPKATELFRDLDDSHKL